MAKTHEAPHDVEAFAEQLRAAREQAGLSQVVLARRLGTAQTTVSSWERGTNGNGPSEPSPRMVFAIEQTLGCEPGALSQYLGYYPREAIGAPSFDTWLAFEKRLSGPRKRIVRAVVEELFREKRGQ